MSGRMRVEEARRRHVAGCFGPSREQPCAGRGRRSPDTPARSARACARSAARRVRAQARDGSTRAPRADQRRLRRRSGRISSSMYSSFLHRRPVRVPRLASATPGSATPRTSRRSLRRDGSGRTRSPGAGRSSCCRASACSTRGTASSTAEQLAAAAGGAAARTRCRWRAPPRAAGSSAPLGRAALDLQHLASLQLHQPRVRQVERDGDARHAVGREPVVREPEVGPEAGCRALRAPAAARQSVPRASCLPSAPRDRTSAGRAAPRRRGRPDRPGRAAHRARPPGWAGAHRDRLPSGLRPAGPARPRTGRLSLAESAGLPEIVPLKAQPRCGWRRGVAR